ncbi:MAG: L-arabinose isomerase family protein [Eubacteriales bacterium]|jgi:L-arabinose isomerase
MMNESVRSGSLRVGLLPLYFKLYDELIPDRRIGAEAYHALLASLIEAAGVTPVNVPVCRVKEEVDDAISLFETENVDCVVVLNLSYSPSMEAVYSLSRTALPVLLLLTTPDSYGFSSGASEIDYNQGLLGAQDLAAMLRRSGKNFAAVSGHTNSPEFLPDVMRTITAAAVSRRLKSARVGMIGEPFRGMGDIQLGGGKMKDLLGIDAVKFDMTRDPLSYGFTGDVDANAAAMADADREIFFAGKAPRDALVRAEKYYISLRRWLSDRSLGSVTMNFTPPPKNNMFDHVPQFALSKLMGEGYGAAADGDAMSAALSAALSTAYSATTPVSMFCPDWKSESVYLSSRAGVNPRCLSGQPSVTVKKDPLYYGLETIAMTGALKAGYAGLVSLAPQDFDRFDLIYAGGEMLDVPGNCRAGDSVRGWFRPHIPLNAMLSAYSENGGSHHLVLSWCADPELIRLAAVFSGFGFVKLC